MNHYDQDPGEQCEQCQRSVEQVHSRCPSHRNYFLCDDCCIEPKEEPLDGEMEAKASERMHQRAN